MRSVVNALNRVQALIEFDLSGTIIDVNDNFLAAVGYTRSEVVGQHHRIFVEATYADSEDYLAFWDKLKQGHSYSALFPRLTKEGQTIWLQASYNPVFDETSKLVSVLKIATDVTEQKRAEADAKGQLEAINRSLAVVEFSLDGTIRSANTNFCEALGYSEAELVGQHHRLMVDPKHAVSEAYANFWERLKTGEAFTEEFVRYAKDGRPVWIQASYNPILDSHKIPYKVVKYATDVTEQKRREADFRGQLEAINRSLAVVEFGLDGKIQSTNANFCEALGYSEAELVGQHHQLLVDPKYAASEVYANFWRRLRAGEAFTEEFVRYGKDGCPVWIQASYNPILDSQNTPYKVVKYATDVTEQRQKEADSKGQLEAIDRSLAVIEFDLDGTIQRANSNYCRVVGYSEKEIVGRHHSIFVDAEYAASAAYTDFWKRLKAGEVFTEEFVRYAKDGQRVWIQASYNPILDSQLLPYKVVKYATDVTEQRQREVDVRGQFEAIDRSLGVIHFGLDGTIQGANANYCEALGYSEDEIIGKHHRLFVDPEYAGSAAYADFWHRLQGGEAFTAEFPRRHKNGREIWIQASYNPILDLKGQAYKVVKYATDVTEQKLRSTDFQGQVEAIRKVTAVIEFELDGTIRTANELFLNLMGYTLQEIKGRPHAIFLDRDYVKSSSYRRHWDQLRDGKFLQGYYPRYSRTGQEIWIHASYNPILGPNGKPYKVVKFATEVTGQVSVARSVETSTERLLESSRAMATTLEKTSAQVKAVNEAASSVSSHISRVASGMGELESSAQEIARNASSASLVSFEGVEVADSTNAAVAKLGGSSDEIGKVIKVITSIAEQTNLLALNATIEAARAGESGKGFAVVATEVKELAKETAAATEDIGEKIEAIQADTNNAMMAIDRVSEIIKRVSDMQKTIAAEVEQQTAVTSEMSRGIREVSQGAVDIAETMGAIATDTGDATQNAHITESTALELSRVTSELDHLAESHN
ncbi:MAG: PAS domain-containing methyl-accepting chemotaxis protein [Myxococcales bacterium]|nr:PAS domain-containing methyl-accepting chemotaxis protein [Myxococcales bacterium]